MTYRFSLESIARESQFGRSTMQFLLCVVALASPGRTQASRKGKLRRSGDAFLVRQTGALIQIMRENKSRRTGRIPAIRCNREPDGAYSGSGPSTGGYNAFPFCAAAVRLKPILPSTAAMQSIAGTAICAPSLC